MQEGEAAQPLEAPSPASVAASPSALRLAVPLNSLAQATAMRSSRLRAATPTNGAKDGAFQNQLVSVEERLNAQILRVQQQGDRMRDVALSRMEAKVGAFEALQPKFDRRLAELSGSVKGLSDEMQSQLRRVDQIDSRLWEWRHQLEEELRGRLSEVEQSLQQAASAQRVSKASSEDSAKKLNARILRIEGVLEEHHSNAEDASTGIVQLHSRLEELEESHQLRHAQHDEAFGAHAEKLRTREAEAAAMHGTLAARVAEVESQSQASLHKLEMLAQESHDFRSRLEVQEEKGRSLRTLQDTKDEQFRALVDRVERDNFDGRLRSLQTRLQEIEISGTQVAEQLQICQQAVERQEQSQQHQLSRHPSPRLLAAAEPQPPVEGLASRVWQGRIEKLEEQLLALQEDLQAVQSEHSLAPHISALVNQLKDITPKVISHENDLQKLQEQVKSLEARPIPDAVAAVAAKDAAAPEEPKASEPPGPKPQPRQTLPEAQESPTLPSPTERDEIDCADVGEDAELTPQQARAAWRLRQNSPRQPNS